MHRLVPAVFFLHSGLSVLPVRQPGVEFMPRMQSLPRPDPETRGDTHYQSHQILDHVDGEVWSHSGPSLSRAGNGKGPAVLAEPASLPVRAEGLLIEEAGDNDGGRDSVENAEYPDSHHKPLQLLCLSAVVLHDGADSEQWHKPGKQKGGTDKEIDEEWGQHKASQRVQITEADEADATEHIPFDLPHGQDADGLHSWHCPGCQVEILRVSLNSFVAPLHTCSQEPGEGQDDPPDGAGHAEEIQHHEEDSAAFLFGALDESFVVFWVETVVAHHSVPQEVPSYVCYGNHSVAAWQKDDGSLGVSEALHIN